MSIVHKAEPYRLSNPDSKANDTDFSQSALDMLLLLQTAHERLSNALTMLDLSASDDQSKIDVNLSRSTCNAQTAFKVYEDLKSVLTNVDLSSHSDRSKEKARINVSPSDHSINQQEQACFNESAFRADGSDEDDNRLIGWHACHQTVHRSSTGSNIWEIWRWTGEDGDTIGRVLKPKPGSGQVSQ